MSGMAVIFLIFVILAISKGKGSRRASYGWSTPLRNEQPRTPDELARDRYARGEIDWPEYQEVLVNLLKDRYVRGELELDDYERRASLVLDGRRPERAALGAQLPIPSAVDEPRPVGLEATVPPQPVADEPSQSVDDAPQTAGPASSTATGGTANQEQKREARADSDLDTLRWRFLTGEITVEEYEEERKQLMVA